jgi:hypothetical protein
MTHCIKCHRPMKHASPSGMGPVCAKRSEPPPVHERDLFGFDVAKAAEAAQYRIGVHIRSIVIEAHIAVRRAFRDARVRAGVWSK